MTGFSRLFAAVVLTLLITALAHAQQQGALDSSFDGDGRQTTDITGGPDAISDLEIDSNGRIVSSGFALTPGGSAFPVTRHLGNGAPDGAFAGDGSQIVDIGENEGAAQVALQPDGRIVLGGYAEAGGEVMYAAARLISDGSLDSSFAGDGIQSVKVGLGSGFRGYTLVSGLAIAPGGEIVLAGGADSPIGDSGVEGDVAIVRFELDGDPDPTFSSDGDGIQLYDLGREFDRAMAVAVQPDGKIVLLVESVNSLGNSTVGVLRLEQDGDVDLTFSSDGFQAVDAETAGGLVLQPDGRIVVSGGVNEGGGAFVESKFVVARLTVAGEPDPSFGVGGRAVASMTTSGSGLGVGGVRLGADGSIFVGGRAGRFAAVRFAANGTQLSGVTTVDAPGAGTAIGVQRDQRVVLGGGTNASGNQDFLLVRLASLAPLSSGPGPGPDDDPGTAAFGDRTRVGLNLPTRQISPSDPIETRIRNRNAFRVTGTLGARTLNRVSVSRKRRVALNAKAFRVAAKSRKTVKLRVPKTLRGVLTREGKLALRLVAKVKDPAGNRRKVKKRVVLRLED